MLGNCDTLRAGEYMLPRAERQFACGAKRWRRVGYGDGSVLLLFWFCSYSGVTRTELGGAMATAKYVYNSIQ